MQVVLVRVGTDSGYGSMNAPVNPATLEFAYVPIPEDEGKGAKPIRNYDGCKITYEQFEEPCKKFGQNLSLKLLQEGVYAHLDPDFEHLTYGDEDKKGKQLENMKLKKGDMLAFYAGLAPPNAGSGELIQALIGFYVLSGEPVQARSIIDKEKWRRNAHTRREPGNDDIVFEGKEGDSGRLERCIPIGEYRGGYYYLKADLKEKWEEPKAVYLMGPHNSLHNPERFNDWFKKKIKDQNIKLVQKNNLE